MKRVSQVKSCITASISVIILVLLDQYTKLLAITHLKNQDSFVIWENVFELQYLENRGAAFGIMQNQRWFFVVLTTVMLIAIAYIFYITPKNKRYLPLNVCLVFVVAGAIGNFIDRLFRGFVVDFFYFSLINFPIFNVADIYVTVTFFVLVLLLFFYYKDEDLIIYSKEYRKAKNENRRISD